MTARVGVLAMAYGTAAGPGDVERYYTDIRGGRPPTEEYLAELRARYAAIGNRFPLLDITRAQGVALEAELNRDGGDFSVYLGMKHSPPFIAEGVRRMMADGIERAVGLVLAPHWSGMSVESYVQRVEEALSEAGAGSKGHLPAFSYVRHWHDHPRFVDFLASRVDEALSRLGPRARTGTAVIFSAHSLPTRTLPDGTLRCKLCHACPEGCRYVAQLQETADLVAGRLGLSEYTVAWQSAGRTADPWWGPPVEDVIRDLAAAGHAAVVICSAGFVSDHLEILYDLDIVARAVAEEAGIAFARTKMPNADPEFVRALAEVVRDHVGAEVPR